jgi:hypothetical protein
LAYLFPKCPQHFFFLPKNKKIKKTKKIYKYMLGWPATQFFVFLDFFLKKCARGILGINTPNGLNCHNLKVWGGGEEGVKCHILNFEGKSENEWILGG